MEPEILFRGKRLDNGEWMYGIPAIFINVSGAPYTAIIPIYSFANDLAGLKAVDPATVGQYTGLSDKNGVKIFKDDILHVVTPNTRGNFQVKFGYGQFYIGINMLLHMSGILVKCVATSTTTRSFWEVRNDTVRQ